MKNQLEKQDLERLETIVSLIKHETRENQDYFEIIDLLKTLLLINTIKNDEFNKLGVEYLNNGNFQKDVDLVNSIKLRLITSISNLK
jgi:hypothetical protein